MFKLVTFWCAVAAILMVTACDRQSSETSQQNTQTQQPAATAPAPAAPAAPSVKSGKVTETMNAGGYTYLLVDDGTAQTWLAVLKTNVAVGQEISYYDGMVMQNFESKTLGRTFDSIIFSNGLVGTGTSGQAGSPPTATGDQTTDSFAAALQQEGQNVTGQEAAVPSGSRKAVVPFTEINVDKASGENSFTVGELYEKAADLDGKTVQIRGKVVKVSANIMGKNWIHIQDGTGNPEANTHDLVITTSTPPEDGWDVITVSGVISANKDFGAGYSYAVILEEAEISE